MEQRVERTERDTGDSLFADLFEAEQQGDTVKEGIRTARAQLV